MALGTLDDVIRILRASPPGGYPRIKIGDASTDDLLTADATSFLDAQEAYIISRIGFLPPTNALMKEVHANLTAYQIFIHMVTLTAGGEVPEFVQAWVAWAEDILDRVVKGEIQIARPQADALPLQLRSSNFKKVIWEKIKLQTTEDWASLSKERILAHSEKVHSTKEGGDVYVRNADYEMSYKTGEIRRIDGAITEDQEVYVDYLYIDKKDFYEKEESVSWDAISRDRYRN